MSLIQQGRFGELTQLLAREEFGPLRPLLLLLGWSQCHTVDAAGSLLDAIMLQHVSSVYAILWPFEVTKLYRCVQDADEQPLVLDACQKLAHQTQLVQWCLEKTRYCR